MALIICEECKKEISCTAEYCPHCGHKTAYSKEITQKKDATLAKYICIVAIAIGLFLLLPAMFTLIKNYNDWYFWNWYSNRANTVLRNFGIGAGLTGSGLGVLMRLKKAPKKGESDSSNE